MTAGPRQARPPLAARLLQEALRHQPQRRQAAQTQSRHQTRRQGAGVVADVHVTAVDLVVEVIAKNGTARVDAEDRVDAPAGFQDHGFGC